MENVTTVESPEDSPSGRTACYACLLFRTLIGPEDKKPFHVTLINQIALPFVPTSEISLGLEVDSHFQNDETHIDKVMWHKATNTFHVECELSRGCGEEVASYYLRDGWQLDLETAVRFKSAKDALSSAEEYKDETVIAFDGGWYTLTPSELWCLVKDGRVFEIVKA